MLERNTMMIGDQFYGRMPDGWYPFQDEATYSFWLNEAVHSPDVWPNQEALKWA